MLSAGVGLFQPSRINGHNTCLSIPDIQAGARHQRKGGNSEYRGEQY